MKGAYIDVEVQLHSVVLAKERHPQRYILELVRDTAERKCEEAGGRLRTDRAPELVMGRGTDPLSGADLILVASRWAVDVPEDVQIRRGPSALAGG